MLKWKLFNRYKLNPKHNLNHHTNRIYGGWIRRIHLKVVVKNAQVLPIHYFTNQRGNKDISKIALKHREKVIWMYSVSLTIMIYLNHPFNRLKKTVLYKIQLLKISTFTHTML